MDGYSEVVFIFRDILNPHHPPAIVVIFKDKQMYIKCEKKVSVKKKKEWGGGLGSATGHFPLKHGFRTLDFA